MSNQHVIKIWLHNIDALVSRASSIVYASRLPLCHSHRGHNGKAHRNRINYKTKTTFNCFFSECEQKNQDALYKSIILLIDYFNDGFGSLRMKRTAGVHQWYYGWYVYCFELSCGNYTDISISVWNVGVKEPRGQDDFVCTLIEYLFEMKFSWSWWEMVG